MIRSMTGYGRGEVVRDEKRVLVELRSVNHRYCDITIKLPKKLCFLETVIRNLLKQNILRGKVDAFITFEESSTAGARMTYHPEVAEQLVSYVKQISTDFAAKNDLTATFIARFPEVISMEQREAAPDEDALRALVEEAVMQAIRQHDAAKTAEGEHLYTDILRKIDVISGIVAEIDARGPVVFQEYKDKLYARIKDLLEKEKATCDEGNLSMELAIYAERVCIDEELVRLRAHVEGLRRCFEEPDSVGRKLDFITQEMNREANTILSKINDIEMADKAIILKTEIEKIREQVQNIE